MRSYTRVRTGIRHMERGMKCQDAIGVKMDGNRICMALTDGRGDSDANAKTMNKVVCFLQEFLLDYYEDIFVRDDTTVAYNILFLLGDLLEREAKKLQVAKSELASTLLAFIIDPKKQSYCAIHLGDGLIALQDSMGKVRILSEPLNGNEHETILSTSEYALKYLKVYRGKTSHIEKILMMTDGVYERRIYKEDTVKKIMKCPWECAMLEEKIDDQAIGMIDLSGEDIDE